MTSRVDRIKEMRNNLYERVQLAENEVGMKQSIYLAIKNGLDDITDDMLDVLDEDGKLSTIGFIEFLDESARKTLGV